MKRGEIYFISSTYKEEGSEQRADRPAVIVSNDKNNEHSEVVEIVYMTTRPKIDLPTHVFTRSALSPSTILCEQVHSVSKKRVGALIGRLNEGELQALNTALMISLDLDFGEGEKTCPADCQGVAPVPEQESESREHRMNKEYIEILQQKRDKLKKERDTYRLLYNTLLKSITEGVEA